MASIDWPATLPGTFQQDSFEETLADNTVRSSMSVGPDKVRKRYTAGVDTLSGRMKLDQSQLSALRFFYLTTTNSGVELFNFTHPVTGSSIECRFSEPPIFRPDDYQWTAVLSLEVIP